MEIKYQSGLQHQQKAVDAITKVFEEVAFEKPSQLYENPKVALQDTKISENIHVVQQTSENNVPQEYARVAACNGTTLHLDIKMETGTGKTYVYTHAIYELHKRFGINKFIVAVPSLAIKEGAKSFLADADVKRHFSNDCGYNAELNLYVLKANQAKKGKRYFPSEVRGFVDGNNQLTNQIYVLLVNMALLTERKDGLLGRDDYDTSAQGFHRPLEALKATRPFLIIDEPHRFSRDQKAFGVIVQKIAPQCIIRFGATFPDVTEGKGKNKVVRKDYLNLLYNLNSCAAFNQNLIKGVAKEHFDNPDSRNEKIKLLSIESKTSATLIYINETQTKSYTLRKGDSLASISSDMAGLNIKDIGKDYVEFSNGQVKRKGEEFSVTICAPSYQEAMMRLAIERHFQTERANFNRSQRIKTLALFFIDDIQSFRGDENGNGSWLRDNFNSLLKERIEKELEQEDSTEYADFLKASLQKLNECSAGYFAQDNSDSDEAVAKEVDDILRNKKGLLSFKKSNGGWNVRRFLFSKWTLKEGWDNPNVFTIAKLRSSGSENSKIQEVGRGLRLPVDEYGNRISNEEFMLNYIVDFQEADFANKLVAEINGDASSAVVVLKITEEQLEKAAEKRGVDKKNLFIELLSKDYIDTDKNIISENITSFYEDYPEFKPMGGINSSKVTDRNKKATNMVRIRKEQYDELKDLWKKINQKFILFFDMKLNESIEQDFHLQQGAFSSVILQSQRQKVETSDNEASVESADGVQYEMRGKSIPYNEFLKRISKSTSLPIQLIHKKVTEYFKKHPPFNDSLINESSMTNFISQFTDWKIENAKGLLNYKQANYNSKETALTDVNGKLKAEIAQGLIGSEIEKGTPSNKYLYESIAYDSDLERKDILSDIEDVVVFGKIPRRSIAIPTIIDNYSPDFMYVVKKKDGQKELNVVIETKGVEGKTDLRATEQIRIECAKKFFEQLKIDGVDVKFCTQINNKAVKNIVEELMAKS
ncbi:MAG: type III restriction-modification system endonuclease [Paludibacteraceae bacterium]|nr:type III restriction-modification system endonuclease [Paludibacteraceae bacterium]